MASIFLRLARLSLSLALFIPLTTFTLILTTFCLVSSFFLSFVTMVLGELRGLPYRVSHPVILATRRFSKYQRTRTAALARKKARKHREVFGGLVATKRLPGNNMTFEVPGYQTYSGRDVRKAVYASRAERAANIQRTQSQIRCRSALKPFHNYNHRIPHSSLDMKPLPNMQGSGHEFPIGPYTNRQKGPARIVVQFTNGHTELQGVVARDVSRPPDSPGSSDDFEVKPDFVEPFWDLGETFMNTPASRRGSLLKALFVR